MAHADCQLPALETIQLPPEPEIGACGDSNKRVVFFPKDGPFGPDWPVGYYPICLGDVMRDSKQRRLQIVRKLGWGRYASVWLARRLDSDSDTPTLSRFVAVKVLTSVGSGDELTGMSHEVINLRAVRAGNESHPGFQHCLKLDDAWLIDRHWGRPNLCLSSQVLGFDMATLRRSLPRKVFPVSVAKSITKQTLLALAFLHNECQLMHTDIKPENILVAMPDTSEFRIAQYLEEVPSEENEPIFEPEFCGDPFVSMKLQPLPNFGLNHDLSNLKICLIDFGSSLHPNYGVYEEIQTPAYRAPDVILLCPWSFGIDIWSVGCIIFDYLVGHNLFPPYLNPAINALEFHIRRIMEYIEPFPQSFLARCLEYVPLFNADGNLRSGPVIPRALEDCIRSYGTVDEIDIPGICAFMRRCLTIDPEIRPSARELLTDAWLNDV